MSIPKPLKKINIVVLVAVCVVLGIMFMAGSFKLGSITRAKEPVRVIPPSLDFSAQNKAKIDQIGLVSGSSEAKIGLVVASKSGSKYHLPDCPGVKTILPANKITFSSPQEAERAGYTPAANCPGLKTR